MNFPYSILAQPSVASPALALDREHLPAPALSASAIDQVLVHRFKAKDETAFIEIMDRHRRKIFAVSLGLLRNHADAEEITQDTFIRAYRGLARFRGDSSLATWLYRIAVNLARNRYWYFFRRRRQDTYSLDYALDDVGTRSLSALLAGGGQDPAENTVAAEFTRLVDACLERLAPRPREILHLRIVLDRSYREIAETLEIKKGTVKSRIARARGQLRALMSEACPDFSRVAGTQGWFLRPSGR